MSDGSYDSDGTNTWMQPRFVLAAVVVALIAVFAVVLTITGPADSNDRDPTPRTNSATPSAEPDPAGDSDSACGLEAGDQTIPVTAPADTQWELVGTVAAPTAPDTIGPGVVDDGLRSCFARSPTGALYAAVNFIATASDPALRQQAVRSLTASGPGRDRALREVEGPQNASGNSVQLGGFTILNYSDEAATVDLAFRATRPGETVAGLVHLPLSLRWEDGDWKAAVPPTGELFPGLGPIPDLTGYAAWSGV